MSENNLIRRRLSRMKLSHRREQHQSKVDASKVVALARKREDRPHAPSGKSRFPKITRCEAGAGSALGHERQNSH
jgi:hypothetical protein